MKKTLLSAVFVLLLRFVAGAQWSPNGTSIYNTNSGNVGIGTSTPQTQFEVTVNSQIGIGANKFNTPLTLIKNGDQYGTDNPVLLIKHSGTGSNVFAGVGSDLGVIRIQGFSTGAANKSINSNDNFYVYTNGTVAVNTDGVPAGYNMAVNGSLIATSVTVKLKSAWPDYVFLKQYKLSPLATVKAYIARNNHLPGVPSATEIAGAGQDLGDMNRILLKKVEELTLYLIEKDKQIIKLQNRVSSLERKK